MGTSSMAWKLRAVRTRRRVDGVKVDSRTETRVVRVHDPRVLLGVARVRVGVAGRRRFSISLLDVRGRGVPGYAEEVVQRLAVQLFLFISGEHLLRLRDLALAPLLFKFPPALRGLAEPPLRRSFISQSFLGRGLVDLRALLLHEGVDVRRSALLGVDGHLVPSGLLVHWHDAGQFLFCSSEFLLGHP